MTDPWERRAERFDHHPILHSAAWVAAIIVAGLAISTVLWLTGVATAPWFGRGEAIKRQQSADNRIFQQAYFNDQYQEILSADERIQSAADALRDAEKSGDDSQVAYWRTNLVGLKNHCVEVIHDYDAQARKYLAADFRDADLPAQIDQSDPATDCQEA